MGEVDETVKEKQIREFNAQFIGFADREVGFAEKKYGISVQEFVRLYNLVKNWNEQNPSDIITIKFAGNHDGLTSLKGISSENINSYIRNFDKTGEEILADYFKGNTLDYYIEFKSTDRNETKFENDRRKNFINNITIKESDISLAKESKKCYNIKRNKYEKSHNININRADNNNNSDSSKNK